MLVVEDDAGLRHLFELAFADAGYRVTSAANGRDALRCVLESPPNLVITDYVMPDIDGLQLVRALRADSRFAAIPVIVYTGCGSDVDLVDGLSIVPGEVHVVTKGRPAELLRFVDRIVKTDTDSYAAEEAG